MGQLVDPANGGMLYAQQYIFNHELHGCSLCPYCTHIIALLSWVLHCPQPRRLEALHIDVVHTMAPVASKTLQWFGRLDISLKSGAGWLSLCRVPYSPCRQVCWGDMAMFFRNK